MHRLRGGQRILYHSCTGGHGQDRASLHGDRSHEKVAGIMSETLDSKQVAAICRKTRRPSAGFSTVKSTKGLEHACQNGLARRDAQLFLVPEVKQVSDGPRDESQVKLLVC